MLVKILSFAATCAPAAYQQGLVDKLDYAFSSSDDTPSVRRYANAEDVSAAYLVLLGLVLGGLMVVDTLNLRTHLFGGSSLLWFIAKHFDSITTTGDLFRLILTLGLGSYLLIAALLFFASKFATIGYIISLLIVCYSMFVVGDIATLLKLHYIKGVALLSIAFTLLFWQVDHPDLRFSWITRPAGVLFFVLSLIVSRGDILRLIENPNLTSFAKGNIPLTLICVSLMVGSGLSVLFTSLTRSSSSSVKPALTASYALLFASGLFWTLFIELALLIAFNSKKSSSS